AATDRNPTLTFNLAGCYNLTGFATKVDAGTLIDVQVRVGTGEWTTIATGLDPVDATMDFLTLDGSQATEARLIFRATTSKPVLVCEVEWFGTPCVVTPPSPTPTPVPTPTPTPVPTPTPTATPTLPPVDEDCGCKVTGGGFTFLPDGTRVNFGFNAQHDKDGGAKGNINVVVQSRPNLHLQSETITHVTCDIDPASVFPRLTGTATIEGTLKTGEAFVFVVTDVGEPGVLDTVKLTVAGSVIFNMDLAGDRSGGGNIQLHKEKCD
ncbi:MAG: post-COAP-1 domain-containing protein, partial [Candidatus Sericytochromatia bacterium]